jgi:WD40 repeat protein
VWLDGWASVIDDKGLDHALPLVERKARESDALGGVTGLSYLDGRTIVGRRADGSTFQIPEPAGRRLSGSLIPLAVAEGHVATAQGKTVTLLGPGGTQVKLEPMDTGVAAMAWRPDRSLATASQAFELRVVDEAGAIRWKKPVVATEQAAGSHAAFSPRGQRFALVNSNGAIEVRRTDDGKPLASFTGESDVQQLCVSDSGPLIVVARTLHGLTIWATSDLPKEVLYGKYRDAKLSDDGQHLVAVGDYRVEEFRVDGGQLHRLRIIPGADSVTLDPYNPRFAVTERAADPHAADRVELYDWSGASAILRRAVKSIEPGAEAVFRSDGQDFWIAHAPTSDNAKPSERVRFGAFSADTKVAIWISADSTGAVLQVNEGLWSRSVRRLDGLPERVIVANGPAESLALGLVYRDHAEVMVEAPSAEWPSLPVRGLAGLRFGDDNKLWILTEEGNVQLWRTDPQSRVRAYGGARVTDLVTVPSVRLAILEPGRDVLVSSRTGRDDLVNRPVTACVDASEARFVGASELACLVPGVERDRILVVRLDDDTDAPRVMLAAKHITSWRVFGELVALGSDTGELVVAHLSEPELRLTGKSSRVVGLTVDAARQWLASSHEDGTISVWNIRDDERTRALRPEQRELTRWNLHPRGPGAIVLAFAPGTPSPALATGGPDGDVYEWNLGGLKPDNQETEQLLRRAEARETQRHF